ncbi:MAG TPA: DUF3365 domain-containing protein [Desulfobulbus sp.]|nr:DUF3365 domain-containing protein [Desulfobulbus sp.]
MKTIVLVLALILAGPVLAGAGEDAAHETAAATVMQAQQREAMQAVQALAGRLQAELKKAMQEEGPAHAIAVCKSRARVIAGEIGAKHGLDIRRVSLRNRNPDNTPRAWEKKVLEDFERQKRDGRPVESLTYVTVARTGSGRQFRFMKAIPTRAICTLCHGADIAPAVEKELDRLYPEDRARGFRPGDIRGAFVVTRDLR